eukprot:1917212-Rhodomonas_salina.1
MSAAWVYCRLITCTHTHAAHDYTRGRDSLKLGRDSLKRPSSTRVGQRGLIPREPCSVLYRAWTEVVAAP